MNLHKFVTGQAVGFNSRLPAMLRPRGPFEVVSVLPVDEANSPTYRVKSKAEPFARVAKETDLVAVGLPPSEQTAAAQWANPVSGRRLPRPFRSR
jgi:hypothetical protein